jgi:uncharacterized membrane protein
MPTAPNITTGFIIEVETSDITETDETVEEALTRTLSAGFADEDRNASTESATGASFSTTENIDSSDN